MWEVDHKEGWALKNWCFPTVVLEKTLKSPLDSKEIKPANPKGNQPLIFIGRTDVKAEAPIIWPLFAKSRLSGKDPDARKDWGQEKGATENEIVGQHHRLNGHEFEQTQWDSEDTEAWQAALHGVANTRTQLSYWTIITRLRQKNFFDKNQYSFNIKTLSKLRTERRFLNLINSIFKYLQEGREVKFFILNNMIIHKKVRNNPQKQLLELICKLAWRQNMKILFWKDYFYILETDNWSWKFQNYHFEGRGGQDGGIEGI